MHVVRGRNVNQVWPAAVELILSRGTRRQSRNGYVISLDEPVASVYERPRERVLFDPVRDANPIFHLHEALWMFAGRDDATWLDRFVRDFSARFAEDGGRMHGAYGKRWRKWFTHPAHTGADDSSAPYYLDQLEEAVRLLRRDPYDRQVVVSMWDPSSDLGVAGLKDRPCNTHIYFRADRTDVVTVGESYSSGLGGAHQEEVRYLDMTVLCRSNDAVFGAYGANVVHMSVLQEYIACMCGFEIGTYTQISNNLHVYENSMSKIDLKVAQEFAERTYPMNEYPPRMFPGGFQKQTDSDIADYLAEPTSKASGLANTPFLSGTARPMLLAAYAVRTGDYSLARVHASGVVQNDWRKATTEWVARREASKRESGK